MAILSCACCGTDLSEVDPTDLAWLRFEDRACNIEDADLPACDLCYETLMQVDGDYEHRKKLLGQATERYIAYFMEIGGSGGLRNE